MITERPWGYYEIIKEKDNYKIKVIPVNPGQRLSYQVHDKRDEYCEDDIVRIDDDYGRGAKA